MNNKTLALVAIVAVAAVLVSAAAVSGDAFAKCKKKNSQAIAQANVCGNNNSGAQISKCQNLASQNQGDGNAVNVIGVQ